MANIEKVGITNRRNEIDLVWSRVEEIKWGGKVFDSVLNFHGVTGIGKSLLLSYLYELAKAEGIPSALIDMSREKYRGLQSGRMELLVDIVTDVTKGQRGSEEFQRATRELQKLLRKQRENNQSNTQWELEGCLVQVEDAFITWGQNMVANSPLLLLFDTMDKPESALCKWLVEDILKRLLRTEKLVVVVASRKEFYTDNFEINRRMCKFSLAPLSIEDLRKQLTPRFASIASEVYTLTLGHPSASKALMAKLREMETNGKSIVDAHSFYQHINELQGTVDIFINSYVMREIEERLKQTFKIIAVFRRLSASLLSSILPRFLTGYFSEEHSISFYHNLLTGPMRDTRLVFLDDTHRNYVLDPTIRRMLVLSLRYRDLPRYMELNRTAVELYQTWIQEQEDWRSDFILEELYHLCILDSVAQKLGKTAGAEIATQKLDHYLNMYYCASDIGLAGAIKLQEMLKLDEELQDLLADEFSKLTAVIDNFISGSVKQ